MFKTSRKTRVFEDCKHTGLSRGKTIKHTVNINTLSIFPTPFPYGYLGPSCLLKAPWELKMAETCFPFVLYVVEAARSAAEDYETR